MSPSLFFNRFLIFISITKLLLLFLYLYIKSHVNLSQNMLFIVKSYPLRLLLYVGLPSNFILGLVIAMTPSFIKNPSRFMFRGILCPIFLLILGFFVSIARKLDTFLNISISKGSVTLIRYGYNLSHPSFIYSRTKNVCYKIDKHDRSHHYEEIHYKWAYWAGECMVSCFYLTATSIIYFIGYFYLHYTSC